MTTYWPWWASGGALAAIMVAHWFLTGRMMAVSGRITALVNRVRFGAEPEAAPMTEQEMLLAFSAATAAEFGGGAGGADAGCADAGCAAPATPPAPSTPGSSDKLAAARTPAPTSAHVVFFGGLLAGGALAAALSGGLRIEPLLAGDGFSRLFDSSLAPLVLFGGGTLVGFGTRMAGGCTSGHGLCGVSRGQRGSLLATVAFFGTGVAVSMLLKVLA